MLLLRHRLVIRLQMYVSDGVCALDNTCRFQSRLCIVDSLGNTRNGAMNVSQSCFPLHFQCITHSCVCPSRQECEARACSPLPRLRTLRSQNGPSLSCVPPCPPARATDCDVAWINNCVGYYNHRYFVLFLCWLGMGALYVCVLCFPFATVDPSAVCYLRGRGIGRDFALF